MINVKMDKKLIIFLIISSIFIMGASCSDNYNRESSSSIQPSQEAVGGGCGVASYENSDTEIKYVQIAGEL